MTDNIWQEPRMDIGISDCIFYHTMSIPGYGVVQGEWDLRGREKAYLGNVDLDGKRVLELGTASGHLCFTMESMGAEVVACDLSDKQAWDIVPYDGYDYQAHITQRQRDIRRLNNGFWFAHKANKSKAKVVYSTVYEIPDSIGQFDTCVVGSILLHLRDPFLALQRALSHVTNSVIVTDLIPHNADIAHLGSKYALFKPNAQTCEPYETWWHLSPGLIVEFLKILGFMNIDISYHQQRVKNREAQLYTIVGTRNDVSDSTVSYTGTQSVFDSLSDSDRGRLESETLRGIRYSTIAKHLINRGIDSLSGRFKARFGR